MFTWFDFASPDFTRLVARGRVAAGERLGPAQYPGSGAVFPPRENGH